jgi:hypothetical protein
VFEKAVLELKEVLQVRITIAEILILSSNLYVPEVAELT